MGIIRFLSIVAVVTTALLPVVVCADPPEKQPGGIYRSFEGGNRAHDAGIIRGEIESVDYGSGTITVRTGHGREVVSVLPSTSIYAHDEYATLADLHRGASVEISAYELDGRLIAQIIRLR